MGLFGKQKAWKYCINMFVNWINLLIINYLNGRYLTLAKSEALFGSFMQQKGCPVDRICADSFSQAAAAVGMPAIVSHPVNQSSVSYPQNPIRCRVFTLCKTAPIRLNTAYKNE